MNKKHLQIVISVVFATVLAVVIVAYILLHRNADAEKNIYYAGFTGGAVSSEFQNYWDTDGYYDLAAVDEASEAATVDWHLVLERVMPYIDIFVPSVEELCYMLDKERFQEWQNRAAGKDITEVLDIEKDVKPLAQECMKLGAKILLLKCGVPGMYFCSADKEALSQISDRLELDVDAWAGKEYFEKSYVPEKVLTSHTEIELIMS